MARLLLQPVITINATGKIAGITLTGKTCQVTARARKTRIRSNLLTLQAVKGWKKVMSFTWNSALSQDQRDAWNTYAKTHQLRNSKGTLHTVAGVSLYTALNTNLHAIKNGSLSSPPPDLDNSDLDSIQLSQPVNPSPPPPLLLQVLFTTGATPPDGDFILITASTPRNAGASSHRPSAQSFTALYPALQTQPIDITYDLANKFGILLPGKLYDVSAYTVRSSNGARGPRYDAQIVIA